MKQIIFEFKNDTVETFSGTAKNGKPFHIRKQECFVHGNGPYPEKYMVMLPANVEFYAPGSYEPGLLFEQGKFGALDVARNLALVLKAGASRAA